MNGRCIATTTKHHQVGRKSQYSNHRNRNNDSTSQS